MKYSRPLKIVCRGWLRTREARCSYWEPLTFMKYFIYGKYTFTWKLSPYSIDISVKMSDSITFCIWCQPTYLLSPCIRIVCYLVTHIGLLHKKIYLLTKNHRENIWVVNFLCVFCFIFYTYLIIIGVSCLRLV